MKISDLVADLISPIFLATFSQPLAKGNLRPGAGFSRISHFSHLADGKIADAWRLHFSDRDPVEVFTTPPCTLAEMMACYPAALAAEPLADTIRPALRTPLPVPMPAVFPECATCANRRGRAGYWFGCSAREDLPRLFGVTHPLRTLPADGGVGCEVWALTTCDVTA